MTLEKDSADNERDLNLNEQKQKVNTLFSELEETAARVIKAEKERDEAIEALRESQRCYKELVNNMSSGVMVLEATDDGNDFILKDFNKAGERIERLKKGDVLGKSIVDIFPSIKVCGIFDIMQKVWQTGEPRHYPVSLYEDHRIAGWREHYIYKLPTGEVISVYDDATKLKKSEAKFRALTEALFDGVLIHRLGVILVVNQQFCDMLGYTEDELLGTDGFELVSPDDRERVKKISMQDKQEGYRTRLIAKDSNIVYVAVRGRRFKYNGYSDSRVVTIKEIRRENGEH